MLIRVRTNVGLWRVQDVDECTTIRDLYSKIKDTRPNVVFTKPLSLDAACANVLSDESKTLQSLGLVNGHMLFAFVDENTAAAATPSGGENSSNGGSVIQKDGTIKKRSYEEASSSAGFRPGMMSLRSMKMQWTLQEFMAMDSQFTFKIQKQPEAFCRQVSLDSSSCMHFQNYMRMFNFQQTRFGYLYGSFVSDEKGDGKKLDRVKVECIYEPPQICVSEGFEVLDDDNESRVEELAKMLNLKKVGWIVGHPPREEGFQLNANEVIMAAELQLESANGVEDTPFVTVKCTLDDSGNGSFDAFQVSMQCMEMAAEGALDSSGKEPGFCAVADSFTAIQEGKEATKVENNFFLCNVPIVQHESDVFVSSFPKKNREGEIQTHDAMKMQLQKSGTNGWAFMDLLSDFHLLLYLCDFLDCNSDMPKICKSVVDRSTPIDDGYKIIIASMAGLEGNY